MFRYMKWVYGLIIVVLLSATALFSASTFASSTCNFLNSNNTLAAGAMSVPANATPNTAVKTVQTSFTFQCRQTAVTDTYAYSTHMMFQSGSALVSGYNDIYKTNIDGLGVRYTVSAPTCTNAAAVHITGTGNTEFDCPFNTGTTYIPAPMTVTTDFVVTGTLPASATLTSVSVLNLAFTESDIPGGGPWRTTPLTGAASGSITAATCSVNQKMVGVTLDPVEIADLSSRVGLTAAPKSFNLSLTCPAGIKAFVTLTDNTNIANRTTTLGLTADSSAKGVGIQILNSSDIPVAFGPDSAVAGNTNQFLLGTSAGGATQYPFKAQYISTGSIRAGSVNAIATFTFSYQ